MKKEKKEIRSLLLGKAVLDDEGKLITPEAGTIRLPQGIADGAAAVRFLGITGKKRLYDSDLSEEELMAEVLLCMRNIGRGVRLRQQPDAAACLLRYVLTRPAILTFRCVEGHGLLTAWTGRGLTGWISQLRAIRAFERPLSEILRLSSAAMPEEEKENRRGRKKPDSRQETPETQPEEWQSDAEDYGDPEGYGGSGDYGETEDYGEYSGDEDAPAEGPEAERDISEQEESGA